MTPEKQATFHLRISPNTVAVASTDALITVQRFDVCGEQQLCLDTVNRAVDALREAALEVVRQSWRHHYRARVLEATDGLHR